MIDVYLSSFSSSWQTNAPHIPATLHSYAEQFEFVRDTFSFYPYFFHTKKGVESLVNQIESPGVVASNIVSWNFNRSHKFLKLAKMKHPTCLTIAGGNNTPAKLPMDYFKNHPYIDIVVHGEGEVTFTEILRLISELQSTNFDREALMKVDGISFNLNQDVIRNKPAPLLRNHKGVIETPSPFLTGKFEQYFDEVDKYGEFRGGVWETTRGCPYSCTFCDWGQLTNSKIRMYSDDRVFSEIEYIVENFDEIFFADANFGILPRDPEIANRIVEAYHRIPNKRLKTLHVGGAKNSNERMFEIGKILSTTPLTRSGMSLSLQTYTEEALAAVKRKNISKSKIIDLQRQYRDSNIPSYCDLIINCPEETFDSFKQTLNFVLNQDFTDIRMFTMDIYPNSEISSQIEKYKIKTEKMKILNGFADDEHEYIEKVVATSTMNQDETELLRLICRTIEILHLGKWTYFISKYCKDEFGIEYSDFYEKLLSFGDTEDLEPIKLATSEGYIRKFNNGVASHFDGTYSPHNISWKSSFFRKELFTWLCISENRKEFYDCITLFLSKLLPVGWNPEVVKFNQSLIFSPDYDPETGQKFSFAYNWYDYFFESKELKPVKTSLYVSDRFVGRSHDQVKIDPKNLDWMRWAAGGRSYFSQRQNSYIYQDIEIK